MVGVISIQQVMTDHQKLSNDMQIVDFNGIRGEEEDQGSPSPSRLWQRCNGQDIGFSRRIGGTSLVPSGRFFALEAAALLVDIRL
jgi:hypothetical protein